MSKLKVQSFSISLDGHGAGSKQSRKDPLGVGGERLHEWLVATRTFHQMIAHGRRLDRRGRPLCAAWL